MKKSLLLTFIVVLLIFVFAFDSNSVMMDRPGPEPKVVPDDGGGSGGWPEICIPYEEWYGWSDCRSAYSWAQGSRDPVGCFNCIADCYMQHRNARFPTLTCKRTCSYNGKCRF